MQFGIWSRTHCPSSSSLENPVVSGIFMQSFEEQTTQCPSCSSLENPHCVWHHPVSFDNHQGWWRMRRAGLHWCVCPWKETPRSYSRKGVHGSLAGGGVRIVLLYLCHWSWPFRLCFYVCFADCHLWRSDDSPWTCGKVSHLNPWSLIFFLSQDSHNRKLYLLQYSCWQCQVVLLQCWR